MKTLFFDNSGGVAAITGFAVVNNTFLANNRDFSGANSTYTNPNNPPLAHVQVGVNALRCSHNIFGFSNNQNIRVDQGFSGVCDSNLYLTDFSDDPEYTFDDGTNPDPVYTSLAAWQGATGLDTNSAEGDAAFVALPDQDPQGDYATQGYDFTPGGAAAIGTAQPHTQTNGSGSGTTINVDDGSPFVAKTYTVQGVDYEERDYIVVGANSAVRLTSISGNTLTLETPITWNDNDDVWISDASSVIMDDLGAVAGVAPPPAEIYISPTGDDVTGDGSQSLPWQSVAKINGLALAPGTNVYFERGSTFEEALVHSSSGTSGSRITFGAYGSGADPIIRRSTISGDYVTLQNLDIDNDQNSASARILEVRGDNITIDSCSVHNATRDGIDIRGGATDTIIQDCEIYDLMAGAWTDPSNPDAHGIGIRAGNGNTVDVTVLRTNIYRCSGDCIQTDPDRSTNATINLTCTGPMNWYTESLTTNFNAGWVIGNSPGENAIDLKSASSSTNNITITDLTTWGWLKDGNEHSELSNRSAFNLKEDATVTLNRVTVYDSHNAYRLRGDTGNGNPDITIKNTVVYDMTYAFRLENSIDNLLVYNNTFGSPGTSFIDTSSIGTGDDLRNNAFLGTKPTEFSDATNVSASAGDFVNSPGGDYRLLDTATTLVDQGDTIASVVLDRNGTTRTGAYEVGAYDGFIVSAHAYFDSLVAHPQHSHSNPMRSQADIDEAIAELWDTPANAYCPPEYNAGIDSARTLNFGALEDLDDPASGGTCATGPQGIHLYGRSLFPLTPNNDALSSGNVFVFWESYWDTGWKTRADSGVTTIKCWQFGTYGVEDGRRLELRVRFQSWGVSDPGEPIVAPGLYVCDIRAYNGDGWEYPGGGQWNPAPPDNAHILKQGEWIRKWMYVDWDSGDFSLWVQGESDPSPIQVYDRATPTVMTGILRSLYLEGRTSQSGPVTDLSNYMAYRNFVSLRNLPGGYTDASTLVSNGSF